MRILKNKDWGDTHQAYYIEPEGIRISRCRHSASDDWEPVFISTTGRALMKTSEAYRYIDAMRKALQLAEKLRRTTVQ